MAALLIANRAVIDARITLPLVGVWHADLIVDGETEISGSQTLTIGDGSSWKGTATHVGTFVGSARLRLVGGAAGLGKLAKAIGYSRPTVRTVLNDLIGAAGETLSSASTASLLSLSMDGWATLARPVMIQIKALLETAGPVGTVYQMQSDGTLFCGSPSFADSALKDYQVISEDAQARRLEIGSESPSLLPGTVLEGRRISYVEHVIGESKVRSVALYE